MTGKAYRHIFVIRDVSRFCRDFDYSMQEALIDLTCQIVQVTKLKPERLSEIKCKSLSPLDKRLNLFSYNVTREINVPIKVQGE
jgi:hypothetical protein